MSVIDPASASGGPVRVAMILANPCTNDARVIKEAEALVRRGYEVRVFCLAAPGLPDIEQSNGVVFQRIRPPHRAVVPGVSGRLPVIAQAPQSRAGRIAVLAPRRWAASLKRLVGPFLENELLAWAFVGPVARFRPHIVHAHDFNTLTAALRAARKTGAAVVYDMHEMEEARLPMAGPLLARFKQAIERRVQVLQQLGRQRVCPTRPRQRQARHAVLLAEGDQAHGFSPRSSMSKTSSTTRSRSASPSQMANRSPSVIAMPISAQARVSASPSRISPSRAAAARFWA